MNARGENSGGTARGLLAIAGSVAIVCGVVASAAGIGTATVGRSDIVTGTDAGLGGGHVKAFSGVDSSLLSSFFAYDTAFTGGVRVAAGDVNGDGRPDIVTGSGAGADHVKVFSGTDGSLLRSFLAYGGYAGGLFVGAGDVNGDGWDDVVTGTDAGAPGGHVKVFDGQTGAELSSFFAYDTAFTGGVRVAVGDVNADGFADVITGTGVGAAHVKAFSGHDGSLLRSFLPYGAYTGGIFVAARDAQAEVPSVQIGELIDTIEGYGLTPRGHERSLVAKLEAAQAQIAAGDLDGACDALRALTNHVHAQTGKALTEAQAAEVTSAANAIRTALGCPSD